MTILQQVSNIDLSTIVSKVRTKMGMDEATAKRAEDLYRKYLALRAEYPDMILVPPQLADHIWHEHLLNHEKYMSDCEQLFGNYLEHHEDDPEEVINQGWENTKRMYIEEFNTNLLDTGELQSTCR